MAVVNKTGQEFDEALPATRLISFEITGLFGYLDHFIKFPQMDVLSSEPEIIIVEGQNGSGKTTIMKMISGALELDFDQFRNVPFHNAQISFSKGPPLVVLHQPENIDYKIRVMYGEYKADLASERLKASYSVEQQYNIDLFRTKIGEVIKSIDYDLLTIDRSLSFEIKNEEYFDQSLGRMVRHHNVNNIKSLSRKIGTFLRDAQVNYRRFFQAHDLELLPRILSRFERSESMLRYDEMIERLKIIRNRNEIAKSFGLQTNDADLSVLSDLLENTQYQSDFRALTLIDSYLEMHESISKSRELISNRLVEFEKIMSEFLVGKTVRVNMKDGLIISSMKDTLKESDLSSGEFHFLYMMVSALLCQRAGTILAIDEPELSLHVKWQRNLVKALSRCSTGASPIFFLATHSTAISAQYSNRVQRLSAIE